MQRLTLEKKLEVHNGCVSQFVYASKHIIIYVYVVSKV